MFVYCEHVKKVLKWFCKASFYAKIKKYEFYPESVEYLKYILFSFKIYYIRQQSQDHLRLAITEET